MHQRSAGHLPGLRAIARRAMLEHDLWPDFSTAVLTELGGIAAALLLESRIGQQFDALVTGASPKGTWVRILTPPVEGKLMRGFEGLDVGDQVRVTLVATDGERGFIDFARVG